MGAHFHLPAEERISDFVHAFCAEKCLFSSTRNLFARKFGNVSKYLTVHLFNDLVLCSAAEWNALLSVVPLNPVTVTPTLRSAGTANAWVIGVRA